jgi:hypothetical protein
MVLLPRVIGYRVYHGEGLVPNSLPAILDSETHAALKKILNDEQRRTNRFYNKRYYLLSGGILRCFRCGHPLVARPTDRGSGRTCVMHRCRLRVQMAAARAAAHHR